ncbi:MAG: TadE/TadG family type IV pilus assembly protein [Pseudomonadota bacterium]
MARLVTFLRDVSANMAVEFALVAPIMVTLIMAVADFGVVARDKAELQAAARAGLQAVLLDADDLAGAITAAETVAPEASISAEESCYCADGTTVACGDSCASGSRRRRVTVTASRDLTLLFPWPGVEDPFPAQGVAEARVE